MLGGHDARGRHRAATALLALAALLPACTGSGPPAATAAAVTRDTAGAANAPVHVPVQVAGVRRTDLDVAVTAPGRTEAREQDRVRAPFAARLVALHVTDGDRVTAGQAVADIVSKNSQAAVQGAEQMLAGARTAADSADAARALEIARRNLVQQVLHAPAAGVVLSHAAAPGDFVDEGEVLMSIAATGGVFFDAQVTQSDLDRIRAGQHATIDMPAVGAAVPAVVHGLLPAASSQNLSAPVRLDFVPSRGGLAVGLFGNATIVVARRIGVMVVPAAAVLRDDVTGQARVALVGTADQAHWIGVQTGVREGDLVEIVSPHLAVGQRVIVDGQVGLPEGATVQIQP